MHVLKVMSCTACGQQLAGPALQTSSAVITGSVFPSHGCVIASQIVWMTQMSHPPAVLYYVKSLFCLQSRAWNHYLILSLSLYTEDQVYTCNPQQFSCANGNCILEKWVCDGNNDCGDNSDEAQELQCGKTCHSRLYKPASQCTCYLLVWFVFWISGSRTCNPSDFTCPTWYQGSPRCIPLSYVCDGEKDCADAADELHNCPNRTCHMNEFACANGRCILLPFQWVFTLQQYPTMHFKSNATQNIPKIHTVCVKLLSCDRVNDCGDSSDEIGCVYGTCSSTEFTCQNGVCIPSTYACDGYIDCQDGSDELEGLCRSPEPTCAPGQFMCNSGECIDIHNVCNQQRDCSDNSDEKGCGKTTLHVWEKAHFSDVPETANK